VTNQASTIRLVYPQWQGGVIADLVPELSREDASRGYYLGAQLLNFLAPETGQKTLEVPISFDILDRETEKGISSRNVIIKQSKAALKMLEEYNPERIVTLGGECSVSVVPFTFLAAKYPNDIAIIWIDTHPDINLPFDGYAGYHAMALSACLGIGDEDIINLLPE
jgi:arginase